MKKENLKIWLEAILFVFVWFILPVVGMFILFATAK